MGDVVIIKALQRKHGISVKSLKKDYSWLDEFVGKDNELLPDLWL